MTRRASDDMTRGYIDGWSSIVRDPPKGCSVAYRHGWANAKDDRAGKPRDKASVIGARAAMIESTERKP